MSTEKVHIDVADLKKLISLALSAPLLDDDEADLIATVAEQHGITLHD